jgi:hypothetical protein
MKTEFIKQGVISTYLDKNLEESLKIANNKHSRNKKSGNSVNDMRHIPMLNNYTCNVIDLNKANSSKSLSSNHESKVISDSAYRNSSEELSLELINNSLEKFSLELSKDSSEESSLELSKDSSEESSLEYSNSENLSQQHLSEKFSPEELLLEYCSPRELVESSSLESLESCDVDNIDEEESCALSCLQLNTIKNSGLSSFVSSADTNVSNSGVVCVKPSQPRSEVEEYEDLECEDLECEDLECEEIDTPTLSSVKINQMLSIAIVSKSASRNIFAR